ncbi:hypothetical protein ACTWLT_24220 [Micromonospora sp. ZYX-F-536]|uniref:hypothetical protein n=1 Tax=Micromonospora sp. ZYX-F-536 TaxID=3457629 RepID=UPI0040409213
MAGGTWERCVREVTLSADPETVGSVGMGWNNLSAGLGHLRDALVGRSFVGPIATGTERPHVGGLPGMLAGWKGSGGDAYREHLGEIGKQIEDLITDASNVSGALTRIEGDIRKAVSSIPIPLMDDFGLNEWSLPNGTELDDARDGESTTGFLAALRQDYQNNQASYADGAFRDKADDLEATMKVDGQAGDNERGGFWDTKSHLDNWYRDNQQAANSAMSPLPQAVVAERPKLTLAGPDGSNDASDDYRPDTRIPPQGRPDIGGGGGGGGADIGGGPTIGSRPPGIGDTGGPTTGGPFSPPPTADFGGGGGSSSGGSGQFTPPPTGSGYPGGDDGYSTGLAGAAPSGVGSLGGLGGGAGIGGAGLGGAGGGLGGGAGLGGAGGGIGGGVGSAGGIGMGGIPGMVGGGNGKVPPMTSAATALRNATGAGGAGAGAGGARGGMAGAGMMGGGMMGGQGGAGQGGTGSEHSSWLTEDDDPWGSGDGASPGILR